MRLTNVAVTRNHSCLISMVLALVACFPATSFAQGGSIVGTVADTSGAVLPGVTVEASSPALIEKTRTVVTDDRGLYQISDLRPGDYSVTFSLVGFSTVKRDGVELTAGFTATVNAQLRVGGIEETITVSGQAPMVDVRNVTSHGAITTELITELPTGKSLQNLVTLIPGVVTSFGGRAGGATQDVGGSVGETFVRLTIHGSYENDTPINFDGMPYNNINGETARTAFMFSAASVEEVTTETGVLHAQQMTSGIWTNPVPKSGGNRYSGYFLANYTNEHMQSANISPEQIAAGFVSQTATAKIYDVNPAFGGPIARDKLWFYFTHRRWGSIDRPPGAFKDVDPLDYVFTPGEPAETDLPNASTTLHLTWQASRRNRFGFHLDDQYRCVCGNGLSSTTAWEASAVADWQPDLYQGTWNFAANSRLLVEAGAAFVYPFKPWTMNSPQAGIPLDRYQAFEISTGVTFRATGSSLLQSLQQNQRVSATYVTGAHNLKVGLQTMFGTRHAETRVNNDATLRLLNGLPNAVVVRNTPTVNEEVLKLAAGIYAQEQWTLNRVTINAGGRLDYLNAYVPENFVPVTRYAEAAHYPRVDNVPNWWDFSPRFGVAWDIFGTSMTAIKASVGRYVEGITTFIAQNNDPALASVTSATRQWLDANGDFIPQDSELGPLSNANFGKSVVTTRFEPSLLTGFGKRGYNWEQSVGIQHQFASRFAAALAYYHRSFGNFRVADNLLVTPADYDEYCIIAPSDPRLPGGGGEQVCGLYDINPSKFGLQDSLVNLAEKGQMTKTYNGFDVTANLRFAGGGLLQGGVNVGRIHSRACFVIDSPSDVPHPNNNGTGGTMLSEVANTRFCETKPRYQPQVKMVGLYPLPWWELSLSGTYQSLPPIDVQANYQARSSEIEPSLGRPLSQGRTATVSIPLIQPFTQFSDRINQFDFRVTRRFSVGPASIEGQFDLYNALNANPVTALNYTYGPAWLRPLNILPGRIFKVGVQLRF